MLGLITPRKVEHCIRMVIKVINNAMTVESNLHHQLFPFSEQGEKYVLAPHFIDHPVVQALYRDQL